MLLLNVDLKCAYSSKSNHFSNIRISLIYLSVFSNSQLCLIIGNNSGNRSQKHVFSPTSHFVPYFIFTQIDCCFWRGKVCLRGGFDTIRNMGDINSIWTLSKGKHWLQLRRSQLFNFHLHNSMDSSLLLAFSVPNEVQRLSIYEAVYIIEHWMW